MSRLDLAPALVLLAAALALAPAPFAQEETPAPEAPAGAPEAETPPADEGPPAPGLRPAPPHPPPLRPIDTTLDYERWRTMSHSERLTFLNGAVLTLTDVTTRLRETLSGDGRVPPETLDAIVKFIEAHYPKRPPAEYLLEMDRIYLSEAGRTMSVMECFRMAFRRMNSR